MPSSISRDTLRYFLGVETIARSFALWRGPIRSGPGSMKYEKFNGFSRFRDLGTTEVWIAETKPEDFIEITDTQSRDLIIAAYGKYGFSNHEKLE